MKLQYYKDTDTLYINLTEKVSVESQEMSPGVVLDFDENNNIVGIDIDGASKLLNLSEFELISIPSKKFVVSSV